MYIYTHMYVIMGVTSQHLCRVLLITSKSQIQSTFQIRRLYRIKT